MVQLWKTNSNDIYENMAIETWLLKETTKSHVLFWVNQPSVVIGRNQIPWFEADLVNTYNDGLDFARRISGGGTVYHDYGNLNISFIDVEAKDKNIKTVLDVLKILGIKACAGSRNEILVGDKKISGSAYYYYRNRFLHHLTLLVDADLSLVWHYLLAKTNYSDTKAVQSVRQPIGNLSDVDSNLDIQSVISAFSKYYNAQVRPFQKSDIFNYKPLKQYRSWRWNFGQTPDFSIEHSGGIIGVKKGKIVTVESDNMLFHSLIGKEYHPMLFKVK